MLRLTFFIDMKCGSKLNQKSILKADGKKIYAPTADLPQKNISIENRIIKIDSFNLRLRKLVRIFALLNHSK